MRESSNETYTRIYENPFLFVAQQPLSTFSIDVDTASYANVRRFLNNGQAPPPDAVRLEELINYFPYAYEGPGDGKPFGVMVDVAEAPWQPLHRLVRVALKGREVKEERGTANFVFLVDVSGSMSSADKLPLVKQSLQMLTRQLGANDRVALVVYAGSSGLVLPSTPGTDRDTILEAIGRMQAGGSTNGAGGITLAYQEAAKHFVKGGVNRVILCTDGDFNVGISSPERAGEADRGEGEEPHLPERARLRHGQPEGPHHGDAGGQGERQLRLHRLPQRGAEGARGADERHAGDDRQGREDPGGVQPHAGRRLPPAGLREPPDGEGGLQQRQEGRGRDRRGPHRDGAL